jgi:hypothetical protein
MKRKEAANVLPDIGISQILGLVELLQSKGGREDIYKLASELSMELGETLSIIRAAEMLKLVSTPGGDVQIESFGEKVIESSITERKDLICEKLELLPIYKNIHDFLVEREDHEASKQEVLEKLAELTPNEDAEDMFSSVVSWGRYAELFGYNDDSETFYLDVDEE